MKPFACSRTRLGGIQRGLTRANESTLDSTSSMTADSVARPPLRDSIGGSGGSTYPTFHLGWRSDGRSREVLCLTTQIHFWQLSRSCSLCNRCVDALHCGKHGMERNEDVEDTTGMSDARTRAKSGRVAKSGAYSEFFRFIARSCKVDGV